MSSFKVKHSGRSEFETAKEINPKDVAGVRLLWLEEYDKLPKTIAKKI